MLGPQSADREPEDGNRWELPDAGHNLAPVRMKQSDLYTPVFVDFANFDTRTRSILEARLPGCPWQVITEYLLPCMQRGESIDAGALLQNADVLELPMISQTQRFFLTPTGGAVEVENRIVVTGTSEADAEQWAPSIHIIKSGIDDAFSARVEFAKHEISERWAIVDTITQALLRISASEQLSEGLATTFRVSTLAPGISLGLFPLAPNQDERPAVTTKVRRAGRGVWVPQDITVREPSYSDHQVMAAHAFPERTQEIVTSGLLPHLEAFVEREKGLSSQRLGRIARRLEGPLRVSVWRWYSPTRIGSEGFDIKSDAENEGAESEAILTDQLLSMAEIIDPTEARNPRAMSFVGASAQSELQDRRSRTRGRLRMEYLSPAELPDESSDAQHKHLSGRWRDLLILMRDLNLAATKKELKDLLRALEGGSGKTDSGPRVIRLTIQDPFDPEGQRAISPRFIRPHGT